MVDLKQLEGLLALTDNDICTLHSIVHRETSREAALRLDISYETARSRWKALRTRLGLHSERDILLWAAEHGLATPEEIVERIVEHG